MEVRTKWAREENMGGKRGERVRYIVLHGADGMSAEARAAQLAGTVTGISSHYLVDETGVWQSVPENRIAYHCGTRGLFRHPDCRNRSSIGVTLCRTEAADARAPYPAALLARAVYLIVSLEVRYGLEKTCVLRHFDVTGSVCPAALVHGREQWRALRQYL